jgi:2-dehydro-3-deoxy-L-rhamnonate dehydrogenase (NAD+)
VAFELTGQTAIVTGAAGGIGEAIARRLAAAGAAVAIADVNPSAAAAVASSIPNAFPLPVDITHSALVREAVESVMERQGRIDILVNNAGVAGKAAPCWEYSDEEWQQVLDINVNGAFFFCRAVIPHMRERRHGRIVNIASIAGKEGNPNACAYSASKAGVIAFTKSLGKETAKKNIAVNCITPAAAHTRLFDQMAQEHIDFMLSRIPRGRFVEVDEIAAMVAWLVSEENSFTTGGVFDISGGRATY